MSWSRERMVLPPGFPPSRTYTSLCRRCRCLSRQVFRRWSALPVKPVTTSCSRFFGCLDDVFAGQSEPCESRSLRSTPRLHSCPAPPPVPVPAPLLYPHTKLRTNVTGLETSEYGCLRCASNWPDRTSAGECRHNAMAVILAGDSSGPDAFSARHICLSQAYVHTVNIYSRKSKFSYLLPFLIPILMIQSYKLLP